MRIIILFILTSTIMACRETTQEADLIIKKATIWTGNEEQPMAEAMAIKGDRILAVGSLNEVADLQGAATEILDAKGRFITPGFIDTHVHFITGGQNLSSVQLRDASTKEEFIKRIGEFAARQKPGTWILGGDWDHQLWGGELPQKAWVDSVTLDNPILLNRLDGHMAIANSRALKELNITGDTRIDAGEVVVDLFGEPTGMLKEDAYYLQNARIPDFTDEQNELFARTAMDYVASHGVTSVHDMNGFHDQEVFERLKHKSAMITRIYSCTPLPQWEKLAEKIATQGRGDEWLRIGGLKGFVDGSLGSHTAAFVEEYTDAPGEHGYFVNSKENLYQWISASDKQGMQAVVHAIGDSACHELLNIYEQVAAENGPRDRRPRIEHAQHLLPTDFPRFTTLGVIPIVQPYHAIDDGRWAEEVIGSERIKSTYAFKSLIDAGAPVAFGSDWFVAPPIPLLGIYAAVTRRTLDGANPNGWVPEQKVSVEEALRAYTSAGAYASFEEDIKGTLEAGKLADFVILDENLLTINPVEIKNVMVISTWVGGKKVYQQ